MTPSELTAWRKRLDLSKVRAAEAIGCHRNALADWEAGRQPIPKYIALACAAVETGLTVEKIPGQTDTAI